MSFWRVCVLPLVLVSSFTSAPAAHIILMVSWPSTSCSSNSLEPTETFTPLSALGSTEPASTPSHGPPPPEDDEDDSLRLPQPLRARAAMPRAATPAARLPLLLMLFIGSPSRRAARWLRSCRSRVSADPSGGRRTLQDAAEPVEQQRQQRDHHRHGQGDQRAVGLDGAEQRQPQAAGVERVAERHGADGEDERGADTGADDGYGRRQLDPEQDRRRRHPHAPRGVE